MEKAKQVLVREQLENGEYTTFGAFLVSSADGKRILIAADNGDILNPDVEWIEIREEFKDWIDISNEVLGE